MRKILLLCSLTVLINSCKKSDIPVYKDPGADIDDRVEDLFKRMTLEEKVSQLYSYRIFDSLAFDSSGNYVSRQDTVRLKNGAGSFWAWALMFDSPKHRVECINGFQRYLIEKSRLGIPAFVFAEGLHGYMAPGATSFPQAIALGCTWDTALIEQIYTVTALEASLNGVTQFLSPVVDLARDPRWGRTEECFGEDPYLVSRMGLAAVYGFQGRTGIIDSVHAAVTLKHFAGHGQPEGGRNIAPVGYSERDFRSSHLYPFEIAVKKGNALSVMASYNEWDGVPNHINHTLLKDILRNEWGFNGYVMSDGGGFDVTWRDHLAAKDSAESGILSIQAGVDYDLFSSGSYVNMADFVSDGRVPQQALDEAVRNILRVKFASGLFEHPYADTDLRERIVNCEGHKALARKAAHKAVVLLKNDNNTLPFDISKVKTLAVIGPNAADIHLGGYSAIPMQGISVLEGFRAFGDEQKIRIVYAEGCKLTLNEQTHWQVNENPVPSDKASDDKLIREAVAVASASDAVVLVIGENELINREAWSEKHLGDADQLNLVGRQEDLARAILLTGKPVVVVMINGRPLTIHYLAENAPAIIEAWYLGQETGHALADIIFGEVNPGGKLTVTFPRNVGQLPCYYNRKPSRFREYVLSNSRPLYPFGFGLSYTTFEYSGLTLSRNSINTGESCTVTVTVKNTGEREGDEIVQLYIHDLVSVPTRPVMELKDFARITLRPGESGKVEFMLTPEKLEAFGLNMRRVVQPGEYAIMVGKSSVEFLSDTLMVVSR